MTTKLLPCPFCGGPPNEEPEDNDAGVFWIICDNVKDGCGCEGPYKHSVEDAVAAWNRRASLPRLGTSFPGNETFDEP